MPKFVLPSFSALLVGMLIQGTIACVRLQRLELPLSREKTAASETRSREPDGDQRSQKRAMIMTCDVDAMNVHTISERCLCCVLVQV